MQIKKSDLIVLIAALLLVGMVLLYMQVISPLSAEIDVLTSTHTTKSAEAADLEEKASLLTSSNRRLTNSKGEAMEAAGQVPSNPSKARVLQSTTATLEQLFTLAGEISISDSTSAAKVEITNSKGVTATHDVFVFEANVPMQTVSTNTTDAYEEFMGYIYKFRNDFPYFVVKSYVYTPPVAGLPATATINLDILVLATNLEQYKVGICPHTYEDGSACGTFLEFTETTCYKCKTNVDQCPVCQTTMLEYDELENTTTCTNSACLAYLKKCENCTRYMPQADTVCPKCLHTQEN